MSPATACPLLIVILACTLGGCAVAELAGGLAQNWEYQKKKEVLPKYDGLKDQRVAVLVDAPMDLQYEYPQLIGEVTDLVTRSIGLKVEGAGVVPATIIRAWQWETYDWTGFGGAELTEQLDVDRVVLIEMEEYRLNPAGNRWLWDGYARANVSVLESDGFDPDVPAYTTIVETKFPDISGLDRSSATEQQVQFGLKAKFIRSVAWLFYTHEEPKYPDKYRPELDQN